MASGRFVHAIITVVAIMAQPALATDIKNGKAIAEQRCSNCHVIGKGTVNAIESQPIGPDFTAMKKIDAKALTAGLNAPHPVMSKFPSLSAQQVDDLAAYMASVRR